MSRVLLVCLLSGLTSAALCAQKPSAARTAEPAGDNAAQQQQDAAGGEGEEESKDTSKITDLPLLEDLEIPSAEELLTGQEVSWIITIKDQVIFSRSISPRPHTKDKLREEYEALLKVKNPVDPAARAELRKQRKLAHSVRGGFPGNSEFPEFLIDVDDVKDVWHHEDLMIKRADLLLADNKLNEAYELLFVLQTINSEWPGLEDRHQRLMFLDAQELWNGGQRETALVRFEELYRVNPNYPELLDRLSSCTNQLIETALEAEDYRRARYFLHRLQAIRDDLAAVQEWRGKLTSLMQKKLQEARTASDNRQYAEAVSLIEKGAEIWPYNIELRDEYRRIFPRYQVLKVGVLRPAGSPSGYPFPGPADDRYEFLKSRPLFEISQYDGSPRYRTTLIEQWEPTELGRNMVLQLRTDFDYWSSQRPVTAIEIAQTLSHQLNPDSQDYNERLSGYLRSIQVHSPYRMELEFNRAPLRPEAILNHAVLDSNAWFEETNRTDQSCAWVRSVSEPDDAPVFHVAEVRETGYSSHDEALRALFRGEVDYLPTLPLKHISSLQETPPWVVRKYSMPETHVLQFHPQSVLARISELRRALLYALDREEILTEEVLRETPRQFGRLTTSVVPTTSESYSPLVKPFESNLRIALSLALAAAKAQEGQLPTLKMIVPSDSELEPIVDRMIKRWQQIGIEVVVVDPASPEGEHWDIAYRRVSIAEPLTQLWPFLTLNPAPRVADLQDLPGWLRQELIRLDLTTNWEDANTILFRLHEHLWNEVFYLPLWELDRYSIARNNIEDMPSIPLDPYQGLGGWVIKPWFDQAQP